MIFFQSSENYQSLPVLRNTNQLTRYCYRQQLQASLNNMSDFVSIVRVAVVAATTVVVLMSTKRQNTKILLKKKLQKKKDIQEEIYVASAHGHVEKGQ